MCVVAAFTCLLMTLISVATLKRYHCDRICVWIIIYIYPHETLDKQKRKLKQKRIEIKSNGSDVEIKIDDLVTKVTRNTNGTAIPIVESINMS